MNLRYLPSKARPVSAKTKPYETHVAGLLSAMPSKSTPSIQTRFRVALSFLVLVFWGIGGFLAASPAQAAGTYDPAQSGYEVTNDKRLASGGAHTLTVTLKAADGSPISGKIKSLKGFPDKNTYGSVGAFFENSQSRGTYTAQVTMSKEMADNVYVTIQGCEFGVVCVSRCLCAGG